MKNIGETAQRQNISRGRLGRNLRLPIPWHKRPVALLGALAAVLLLAAGATAFAIYQEGISAEDNAKKLLNEYNSAVSGQPEQTASATTAGPGEPGSPAPSAPQATAKLGGYAQPDAPEVDPKDALVSVPGYDVIGKLRIEKIGVELPIISKTTTNALKVSVCWYSGALPGQPGNMVITGHNYKSGAHFGKLDQLKRDDEIVFDGPDGKVYRYRVVEMETVTPDNAAALDKDEGEYTLTLLTCASSGNRRLIVRCALKNSQ